MLLNLFLQETGGMSESIIIYYDLNRNYNIAAARNDINRME
jgi:hypothetical protein